MGGKTQAMQLAMNVTEGGPRWFVVVCHAGRERQAKTELKNQGFEAYLPMRLCPHPKARNPITPFFPRYMFVRFNPTVDQWLCICSTYGVQDILRRADGYPQAVTDRMISRIKDWEVDGVIHLLEPLKRAKPVFKAGDKVRVKAGHYAGMEGLVKVASDSDRVVLMLALAGGSESLKISLSRDALEGAALR